MSDPSAVNAQLRAQVQSLMEEKAKLAAGLKQRLANLISQKNRFMKAATELQAENSQLEAQLDATGGSGGGRPSADELRSRIAVLEGERVGIHNKIKVKLQQLVTEKYELTMRLRELEQNHVDPSELQELRKAVTVLLNEKGTLMQKLGEQRAALQNAQMWLAQNTQLRQQLEKMSGEADAALARVDEIGRETAAKEENKAELTRQLAVLTDNKRDLERRLAEEKASHRNSALWVKQNDMLRNQIARLKNENKVLSAKRSDIDADNVSHLNRASAEKEELESQLGSNEEAVAVLEQSIADMEGEVGAAKEEEPAIEARIQNLIAENTGLKMQVRQLSKKSETFAQKNDKARSKMLDVEEEKNALLLQVEELLAEAKTVEDWEAQNDDLRWNLQELIDENTALNNRIEQLQGDFSSDGGYGGFENAVDDILDELEGNGTNPAPGTGSARGGLPAVPQRKNTIGRNSRQFVSNVRNREARQSVQYSELKERYSTLRRETSSVGDIVKDARAQAQVVVEQNLEAQIMANRTGAEDGVDSSEIKFVESTSSKYPQIRCATLEKLVERLTYEKFPDMEYVQAFMLTYRSFTTPLDLLELIIQRYCITEEAGLTAEESQAFKVSKIIPIRLRVFNVIKGWLNESFYDFENDEELTNTVREFVEVTMPATGMQRPAQTLQRILQRKIEESRAQALESDARNGPVPTPEKKKLKNLSFESVDNRLLAAVITDFEQALYCKIQPKECLGLAWAKEGKETNSPNILALVHRFNDMSTWVQYEVMTGAEVGQHNSRGKIIKKFVRLAKELLDCNNFNGVMEILAGLQASSLYRLRNAWGRVDSRTMALFEDLKETMSAHQSYKKLRNTLHLSDPPCIPYLGMYLTDLTFIEEGNPDFVDGLINFTKRRYFANAIREVNQYQQMRYSINPDPVAAYLLSTRLEEAVEALPDENEAYDLSLRIEPRT